MLEVYMYFMQVYLYNSLNMLCSIFFMNYACRDTLTTHNSFRHLPVWVGLEEYANCSQMRRCIQHRKINSWKIAETDVKSILLVLPVMLCLYNWRSLRVYQGIIKNIKRGKKLAQNIPGTTHKIWFLSVIFIRFARENWLRNKLLLIVWGNLCKSDFVLSRQ